VTTTEYRRILIDNAHLFLRGNGSPLRQGIPRAHRAATGQRGPDAPIRPGGAQAMYLIKLWPGVIYEHREGRSFTLVAALQEIYGVRDASIIREDGTPVVLSAGSASQVTYAPTGRTIRRRAVGPGRSSL
jgi:hypothetical protein